MNRDRLIRGLVFGAIFGVIGIGLFLYLYTTALAGMGNPARLFTAFFVPIVAIGLMVIIYHFLTR